MITTISTKEAGTCNHCMTANYKSEFGPVRPMVKYLNQIRIPMGSSDQIIIRLCDSCTDELRHSLGNVL